MTFSHQPFLDDLGLQKAKYEDIVALSLEQKKLIERDDVDGLMQILERKRRLMSDLEAVEARLKGHRLEWSEERSKVEERTVREVEDLVLSTRKVLEQLVSLEDESRTLMEKYRDATADQLKELWQKKKVREAYGGSGGEPDGRFYDDHK